MAIPLRWGLEFRVNSTLSGAQYDSALAGAISGQIVVLFTDLSSGNTNVRGRFLDAAGIAAANDFVINDVITFNEDSAAIASVANGRMLAVWTDDSQSLTDTSGSAIHGQLFAPTGAAVGAEFVVNTTTPGVQLDPAVTALTGDRFLVSWNDEGSNSLRAQIINFDGTKIGGEITVRSTAGATVGEPTVVALTTGGAFVAWSEQNASAGSLDASGSGIIGQLLDSSGGTSGGPFLINQTTADSQFAADATALSDGRVAVVWTDAGASGGDTTGNAVRARVFNANGTPATAEFLVNTTVAGDQSEPAIAALADGRFVIAWTDASASGGDTTEEAVRARIFTNAGVADSGEFLVNLTTAGRQAEPAIAILADGRFVITWTDESAAFGDASDSAIVGQIFDPRTAAITLAGTSFADDFIGTAFADQLAGALDADKLQGADGDDVLIGGAGADMLLGGAGSDTASYVGSASAVQVNLLAASAVGGDAQGDTLVAIENLTGSALNDTLTGNGSANILDGGLGSDMLAGGGGNDTYFDTIGDTISEALGAGYDTVNTTRLAYTLGANLERVNFTGTGNFVGTGNGLANRFQGGAGSDRFVDVFGGADIFSGGNGTDTVDFRSSVTGAVLNFATNVHGGAAAGDSYSGIEKFLGSNTADDTMTMGGTGRALFVGGGGDDTLTGAVKNDQLIGQAGNDTLLGAADRDSLDGGTGNDTMTGGGQGDVFVFIDAAFGQDTITDYQDGLDSFKVFSAVADDIGDFTISGNGTTSVLLTLNASPTNTIEIQSAANINITSSDFVFY